VAGLSGRNPERVRLGTAAAVSLLVGIGWLRAIPPDVGAAREFRPARPTEGESVTVLLTVTNNKGRRSPPLMMTEQVGTQLIPVEIPSLAGGEIRQLSHQIEMGRRGKYLMTAPTIGHSDPFRLFYTHSPGAASVVLYVHPRVSRGVTPISTGGVRDAEGPTSASSPQGGVAFHSLRDYQPGDDWRLIHWRATAKRDELTVRHHVIPDEPRHVVFLDTSMAPYTDETFDDAVRVAASLCAAARSAGFPLQLVTTGGRSITLDGQNALRDVTPALDLLSEVERSADHPGVASIASMPWRGEALALGVVTGQAQPNDLAMLSAVRSRFLTISLVQVGEVISKPGSALRGVVGLGLRSSEEFAARWNQLVRS
jgi:uncharacterized protein (DUF58 family)